MIKPGTPVHRVMVGASYRHVEMANWCKVKLLAGTWQRVGQYGDIYHPASTNWIYVFTNKDDLLAFKLTFGI